MAVTQYIGARYVPIFADPAEWTSTKQYEPLTIVLHEGDSYTSRQFVPVGVNITNTDYWAETGNYNAQVESYRQEVLRFSDSIQEMPFAFDTVADMQESTSLYAGAICHTNGFHSRGDGGAAWYIVSNSGTANGMDVLQLRNNLISTLVYEHTVNVNSLGAYGDGTHDDSDYIKRALTISNARRFSVDSNNADAPAITFAPKKYYFGSQVAITDDIQYVTMIGNGAFIVGNGFTFDTSAGYRVAFSNFTFADMQNAFVFNERNLEYSRYLFDNIIFRRVPYPFIMNRRSCFVRITNCQFKTVFRAVEVTNCDRVEIDNCWFEPSLSDADAVPYHSIIKQNYGAEGFMHIHDCFFIPSGGTGWRELAWIEHNMQMEINSCRFSGENVWYAVARLGSAMPYSINGRQRIFLFHDMHETEGRNPLFYAETIAGMYTFRDCNIAHSGKKLIEWSDKVSQEQQRAIVNDITVLRRSKLTLDNIYTRSIINGIPSVPSSEIPSAFAPFIPSNMIHLLRLSKKTAPDNNGILWENISYISSITYTDNGYDITIRNHPFMGIATNRLPYSELITIKAMFVGGYRTNYDGVYAEAIISFRGVGTTITPILNWISNELQGYSAQINGNDSVDLSDISDLNEITISINASVASTKPKALHATICTPQDDTTITV